MFGATPSIYFFCVLAVAITMIFASIGIVVTMYVDDLVIYCHSESVHLVLDVVTTFLQQFGLTVADEKTNTIRAFSDAANGLGYIYQVHNSGHAISISLPDTKLSEIFQLLSEAKLQIKDKTLEFELMQQLTGNLTWAANLDRYSMLRFLTGHTKKWSVQAFFTRAVKTTAIVGLLEILEQIEKIFHLSSPQCIVSSDAFTHGSVHIFSDASLEAGFVQFGAFIYNEKNAHDAPAPHQYAEEAWYYYAKTLDLNSLDPIDIKALSIDIWETTAVITPLLTEKVHALFFGKHVFMNIDNSTSSYNFVKLSGTGPTRRKLTFALVAQAKALSIRPAIDYIVSKLNLGIVYDPRTPLRRFSSILYLPTLHAASSRKTPPPPPPHPNQVTQPREKTSSFKQP